MLNKILVSVLGLVLLFIIQGCGSGNKPEVRSSFLQESWTIYKDTFIHEDGYVWDRFRDGGEVTSEGQSYALLRSALLEDEKAFDRIFNWTENNLLRDDGMYSWRWHPGDDSRQGWIVDENTATDADQDIALALIIAARAFDRPELLSRAAQIITAIRKGTGIKVGDSWFLSAGNWANDQRIMNISYFMPYSYPLFHELDPSGNWLEVRSTGYEILSALLRMSPSNLFPDFNFIDKNGHVSPIIDLDGLDSDFSFDAMRIYWRVALDCILSPHLRACSDSARISTIHDIIAEHGQVFSRYDIFTGEPLNDLVSLSFYGSFLPGMRLHHPVLAESILNSELSMERIRPILNDPDRYYDLNWIWFGLAADNGLIKDMTPDPQWVRQAVVQK